MSEITAGTNVRVFATSHYMETGRATHVSRGGLVSVRFPDKTVGLFREEDLALAASDAEAVALRLVEIDTDLALLFEVERLITVAKSGRRMGDTPVGVAWGAILAAQGALHTERMSLMGPDSQD